MEDRANDYANAKPAKLRHMIVNRWLRS